MTLIDYCKAYATKGRKERHKNECWELNYVLTPKSDIEALTQMQCDYLEIGPLKGGN